MESTLTTAVASERLDAPKPSPGEVHPSAEPGPRYHAMDAFRAVAMSLGVVLHGTITYMRDPVPSLLWVVREPADGRVFDWVFWWLHGWRIPAFFLVAGFFAVKLCDSRGVGGFLRHRTRRILVPFLGACATILPLIFVVWACGWLVSSGGTVEQGLRGLRDSGGQIKADPPGPAHLWFLQYLYLYCLMYAGWRYGRHRLGPRREGTSEEHWSRRILLSPWRVILVVVPTALILLVDVDVVAAITDSPVPEPLAFIYFGVFFVVGTWLYPLHGELGRLVRFSGVLLALSLPVFVGTAWLLQRYLAETSAGPGRFALAISMALFVGLSVFGFLGLFLRFCHQPSPTVRYLADASYWVYLIHLPIVGLLQSLLYPLAVPAVLKFLLVVAVTLAVSLVTYRYLVRYTFIGYWLNGPRARPPGRACRTHLSVGQSAAPGLDSHP